MQSFETFINHPSLYVVLGAFITAVPAYLLSKRKQSANELQNLADRNTERINRLETKIDTLTQSHLDCEVKYTKLVTMYEYMQKQLTREPLQIATH